MKRIIGFLIAMIPFSCLGSGISGAGVFINPVISGTAVFQGSYTQNLFTNADPGFRVYESDAAANRKYWYYRNDAGNLKIGRVSDAGVNSLPAITVQGTTTTDGIIFNGGTISTTPETGGMVIHPRGHTAATGNSSDLNLETDQVITGDTPGEIYIAAGGATTGSSLGVQTGGVHIYSGGVTAPATGSPGLIEIKAGNGNGVGNFGGDVLLQAGAATGTATPGTVQIWDDGSGTHYLKMDGATGTLSTNTKVTSIRTPATGFTRISPNYSIKNASSTSLVRDTCTTIAAPASDSTAIYIRLSVTANTANGISTSRTSTIVAYSDSGCTASLSASVGATCFEFVATASTQCDTNTDTTTILLPSAGASIYLKQTDDAGNTGTGSYTVLGVYD